MAEIQDNDHSQTALWLADQWVAGLMRILESMTDAKPAIERKPEIQAILPDAAATGEILWWEQGFNVSTEPALWVGAAGPAWTDLGARTLRAAGIEGAEQADAKSTYLEILSQSLSALAQIVGGRAGAEVVCARGEERSTPPPDPELFTIEVSYPAADPCVIYFAINPAFTTLLIEQRASASAAGVEATTPEADPQSSRPFPDQLPAMTPVAIDLLFDVELPVSVSFGHAHLPLKDILKLNTGSIVELDRSIAEPVDIVINNCVIARGDVVVMDGNYGVRIKHILNRSERLVVQQGPALRRE